MDFLSDVSLQFVVKSSDSTEDSTVFVDDNLLRDSSFTTPELDDLGNLDIPSGYSLKQLSEPDDLTLTDFEEPSTNPSSLLLQTSDLPFSVMLTEKRRTMICYMEYLYQDRKRTRKDGRRIFRCKSAKKHRCKASLNMNPDLSRILVVQGDHMHEPEAPAPVSTRKRKMKSS